MDFSLEYLLLIPIGFIAGFLNTVAGGGTLLTLPTLLFLGLPAPVANGCSELGPDLQSRAQEHEAEHAHEQLDGEDSRAARLSHGSEKQRQNSPKLPRKSTHPETHFQQRNGKHDGAGRRRPQGNRQVDNQELVAHTERGRDKDSSQI